MVVAERDAENSIASDACREPLDEALVFNRLLLRARKPRGVTRRIGKQVIGAKGQGDRRRAQLEPAEFFARDREDEIAFTLGRREVEIQARSSLASVLEREREALDPCPAAARITFKFHEQSAQG